MTETSAGDAKALPNSIVALAYSGLLLGRAAESSVTEKQKAGLVASVALWSLRKRRDIDFMSGRPSRWILPSPALKVVIVRGVTTSPEIESHIPSRPSRYSLEQELLNVVRFIAARPNKEGLEVMVREVIEEWLGDLYAKPHRELIDRVTDQAKTAGCYQQVTVPRGQAITRFLLGPKSVNVLTPTRAAELKEAAEKLGREWQQFVLQEPDLHAALIATVTDAINRRTTPREWGE